jgi:acetylornithine deacetylase
MRAMADAPNLTSTDILDRLVAFDTTSRNSNLPLIGWVRSYLDGFGVPYRLSHDAAGQKANLHAIIGPDGPGGIALSGHVDTVPVDGQAWSADPFHMRREGGRLVARGVADMKGFVACCLAAVPGFQAAGLRRPIHLFISYDEEVDCAGARRLVMDLAESGQAPALCIVGEPTSMQPILGHKGRLAADVTVRGKAGHSSAPSRGVNAVFAAAEAVAWIAAEQRRIMTEGPFAPSFDPPHTTVHVGMMSGGTILNIIPEHASFRMEWRVIPGDDAYAALERLRQHVATLEPSMHAVDPATGFTITPTDWLPGLSLDPNHALAGMVRQLTGSNSAGYVSYGTEAGLYEEAGIPSIVCGPGDIAQAHTADEWIAESQLAACDTFLRRLASQQAA